MPLSKPPPAKDLTCKKRSIRELWTYPALRRKVADVASQIVRHGGFMKTTCESEKRVPQTWPWTVLWLVAVSLIMNAASAAQYTVTECNLNSEMAGHATPSMSNYA